MLAEWFALIPLFVFGIAIVFFPGAFFLRAAGIRGHLIFTAAPPISLGIAATTGVIADLCGIRWSLWTLIAGTLLSTAICYLVSRIILSKNKYNIPATRLDHPRYHSWAIHAITIFVAIATMWPIIYWINPEDPIQFIDSTFHESIPWIINETGNASLLSGASYGYGLRAIPTYYPIVWHIVVATIGGTGQVIEATNVMMLILVLIWCLGISSLAREMFPHSLTASIITVGMTASFPAFPTYMLLSLPLWPNALGISLIPSAVALLLRSLRLVEIRSEIGTRRILITFLCFIIAYLGAVATYPITLLSSLFIIIPIAGGFAVRFYRLFGRRYGKGLQRLGLTGAILFLALIPLMIYLWRPSTASFLTREGYAEFANAVSKIKSMILLWPMGGGLPFIALSYIFIVTVTITGAFVTLRHRKQRWALWSWLISLVMLAACYFPLGPLSSLTGLWYNAPYRMIPVAIIPLCLFAGATTQHLEAYIQRHRHKHSPLIAYASGGLIVAICTILTIISTLPVRNDIARAETTANLESPTKLATPEELALLRRLRGKLDPDLLVLGDPANGSTFVEPISNYRTVFPHLTYRAIDTDALYLSKNFRYIHTDPKVCRIITHYGIGYFYDDVPGKVPDLNPVKRSPGLYHVDTSEGFQLIDHGGTARLFKTTACGPIHPQSNPWALDKPYEPLYNENGLRNHFDSSGKPLPLIRQQEIGKNLMNPTAK